MSGRSWYTDAEATSQGLVYIDFSFLTNGTSNPLTTTFRGQGVANVVRFSTGVYNIFLSDGYRYAIGRSPDLEDLLSGSDDGGYASMGPIVNEGAGHTTPLAFSLYTRAASGTKADFTGRRVSFTLALKNSGNGT